MLNMAREGLAAAESGQSSMPTLRHRARLEAAKAWFAVGDPAGVLDGLESLADDPAVETTLQ